MFFKDAKVLIIGGTGTIGSSLLEQILLEHPRVVRILSRDEYKQYMLQNKLGTRKDVRYLIGDVRDYDRVLNAMNDIDYVFHAAALKHVPACEYNPYEAVLTNIIGTYNVIKASIAQNVKKVTFTSSDKAISPTNTYGATKLTAERLIAASEHNKGDSKTVFSIVRFGNVIGSRGSVIPLFINQIVNEKMITVTNLDMSRFMMTVNQATKLTIKAMKEAKGGDIFILKMPVIVLQDLVKIITEETCKKYNIDIKEVKIEEIGMRPGEKVFEELMTYDESLIALELSDMFIIPSSGEKQNIYGNAKKARKGTYSSADQKILTLEEVRKLVLDQDLI
ncbi:MAG: polysaccharide biosynthesis protein [Bacillota bacterium]